MINRITVVYHRLTRIEMKKVPLDIPWKSVLWDYSEQLIIDRETEALEHIRDVGTGCKISHKYEIKEGVEALLDGFDKDNLFCSIVGNTENVEELPNETKGYIITVDYKEKPQYVIKGSFDRNGLPEDFAEFVDAVFEFVGFYGLGEMLSPSIYGKAKRPKAGYIFCSVAFGDGDKSYYYLTEDTTIEVGDAVIVPAGKDNHEMIVEVVKIDYFRAEDVPMPVEKMKWIIRGCVYEDFV